MHYQKPCMVCERWSFMGCSGQTVLNIRVESSHGDMVVGGWVVVQCQLTKGSSLFWFSRLILHVDCNRMVITSQLQSTVCSLPGKLQREQRGSVHYQKPCMVSERWSFMGCSGQTVLNIRVESSHGDMVVGGWVVVQCQLTKGSSLFWFSRLILHVDCNRMVITSQLQSTVCSLPGKLQREQRGSVHYQKPCMVCERWSFMGCSGQTVLNIRVESSHGDMVVGGWVVVQCQLTKGSSLFWFSRLILHVDCNRMVITSQLQSTVCSLPGKLQREQRGSVHYQKPCMVCERWSFMGCSGQTVLNIRVESSHGDMVVGGWVVVQCQLTKGSSLFWFSRLILHVDCNRMVITSQLQSTVCSLPGKLQREQRGSVHYQKPCMVCERWSFMGCSGQTVLNIRVESSHGDMVVGGWVVVQCQLTKGSSLFWFSRLILHVDCNRMVIISQQSTLVFTLLWSRVPNPYLAADGHAYTAIAASLRVNQQANQILQHSTDAKKEKHKEAAREKEVIAVALTFIYIFKKIKEEGKKSFRFPILKILHHSIWNNQENFVSFFSFLIFFLSFTENQKAKKRGMTYA